MYHHSLLRPNSLHTTQLFKTPSSSSSHILLRVISYCEGVYALFGLICYFFCGFCFWLFDFSTWIFFCNSSYFSILFFNKIIFDGMYNSLRIAWFVFFFGSFKSFWLGSGIRSSIFHFNVSVDDVGSIVADSFRWVGMYFQHLWKYNKWYLIISRNYCGQWESILIFRFAMTLITQFSLMCKKIIGF